MRSLYETLINYCEADYYPFHMPGHKRNIDLEFENPYKYDITEIDGFDNLHHGEGILLEAQKKAAALYQSSETYFLVNGSTCGLLSAISACTKRGGKILVARNSHKAVYHAIFLNELENVYTYPQLEEKYCVNGGLNVENIKQLLINNKNIQSVVITSPTYDGIVSDVESIAKEVHKYNIPLIVDEAHGAHFGFHPYFPGSSIGKGADIVIHSLHKTLPSLTQTALLHVNGSIVNRERLRKYLSIYQTSSPSYVLMASMDNCINMITKSRRALFEEYTNKLIYLHNNLINLKYIKIVSDDVLGKKDIYNLDKSKLIISVKNTNITGKELYLKLLNKYHLQMEMAAGSYVMGITSIMDTREGYDRLIHALYEIDNGIDNKVNSEINNAIRNIENTNIQFIDNKAEVIYKISECDLLDKTEMEIDNAEGRISAEYVYLYPPGIPLIVPGEIIKKELINQIKFYKKNGYSIEGMNDYNNNTIQVIKKDKKG